MNTLKSKWTSLLSEDLILGIGEGQIRVYVGSQKRVPVTRIVEIGEDFVEFETSTSRIASVSVRRDVIPIQLICRSSDLI